MIVKPNSDFLFKSNLYLKNINQAFTPEILEKVEILAQDLLKCWDNGHQVFICGNGGSAANSLHIANDFHYGIGACGPGAKVPGLKVEALCSNQSIITCLANDTGYENIYSHQLEIKSKKEDRLIVLSGSGNSENIVKALKTAKRLSLKTHAVLAFDGGRSKQLAENPIHFPVKDMQIAEDTQLIIGHLCMQWLNTHKPRFK